MIDLFFVLSIFFENFLSNAPKFIEIDISKFAVCLANFACH